MPPITSELCLACSGSAFSGSQKPKFQTSAKPLLSQVSQETYLLQPEAVEQNGGEGEKRGKAEPSVFRTQCCGRPICFACLASNPRLARYLPCLACLGGVRAVAGPSSSLKHPISSSNSGTFIEGGRERGGSINGCSQRWEKESGVDMNLNGELRDRDVFVLGDDDDSDDSDLDLGQGVKKRKSVPGGGGAASDSTSESPPPAYSELEAGPERPSSSHSPSIAANSGTRRPPTPGLEPTNGKAAGRSNGSALEKEEEETEYLKKEEEEVERPNTHIPAPSSTTTPVTAPLPRKHYIQKDDTLRGLALRYNIEGRVLCRLNNLPPSTLTTTPHLLHTRTVLVLPPSAKHLPPGPPGVNEDVDRGRHSTSTSDHEHEDDPERERQIELEKTAKRLQLITKEANWDVAKAYAVLAAEDSTSSSPSSSADFINIKVNSISNRDCNQINRYTDAEKEIHELGGKELGGADGYGDDLGDNNNNNNEKEREEEKEKGSPRSEKNANGGMGMSMSTLQERALDAYLEDDAWEENERRAGRGPVSVSGRDQRR